MIPKETINGLVNIQEIRKASRDRIETVLVHSTSFNCLILGVNTSDLKIFMNAEDAKGMMMTMAYLI